MLGNRSEHQSGFALLILLVILMGVAGIALTGVTQNALKQVEDKRFRHNERVLKEVKQALLQFAYNYPTLDGVAAGTGPGRLPCADTNNDGLSNQCFSFGRLPWREGNLNLYDIRDADGERLWYAVSSNFRTANGGIEINSDISGRITIRDQSGNIIYSGLNPGAVSKYGVAAVIIAPGRVTSRDGVMQNRAAANGENPYDLVADTDPGIIDADNYLDLFTDSDGIVTDNAALEQNSDTGGFILGPVNEQNTDFVNDQIIIITAAEIIEMAEKATLQAYKNAIDSYRVNIRYGADPPPPPPGFDTYPWLDDYSTVGLGQSDADLSTRLGRVPSIFGPYFDEGNQNLKNSGMISEVIAEEFDMTGSVVNGFPLPDPQVELKLPAALVKLDASNKLITSGVKEKVRYYWDRAVGRYGNPKDGNNWEICPEVTDSVQDCNQAGGRAAGQPNPNIVPNQTMTRVLRVTFKIDSTPSILYINNNTGNETYTYRAPTDEDHAFIFSEFTDDGSGEDITVTYEYDDSYLDSFVSVESGTFTGYRYRLGIRYYPVLPAWALEDDWHDSIQMAFSSAFQPVAPDDPDPDHCIRTTDCLRVDNIAGLENGTAALLVLGSAHGIDSSDGIQQDELDDIFDVPHRQSHGDADQDIFDNRSATDRILVIR
jgi:type II secretory pathway pseudopilin PulG